jgi:preprotein translocase subunit SecE
VDKNYTLIVWVVAIGAIFGFLWYKGYLLKITNYVNETREELRKCTWPSRDELKGSTVVVVVTIALLGAFTIGVDFVLSMVMRLIT